MSALSAIASIVYNLLASNRSADPYASVSENMRVAKGFVFPGGQ